MHPRFLIVPTALVLVVGCGASDPESTERVSQGVGGATVQDVASAGCSAIGLAGLNAQIIAEENCVIGQALSPVPNEPNFQKSADTTPYMETPARDALVRALAADRSMTLTVNSMLRTVAEQYVLYAWYQSGRCGIQLAATPGTSNHETGLAFDTSDYAAWRTTLEANGFRWFGSADVVHFDYVGSGATDLRGHDVLAFQKLWNRNHPSDMIAEDGSYGPATEARLKASPADGFPIGAACGADASAPHDAGGTLDASAHTDAGHDAAPSSDSGTSTPSPDASGASVDAGDGVAPNGDAGSGGGCATAPGSERHEHGAAAVLVAVALLLSRRRTSAR